MKSKQRGPVPREWVLFFFFKLSIKLVTNISSQFRIRIQVRSRVPRGRKWLRQKTHWPQRVIITVCFCVADTAPPPPPSLVLL